MHEQQSYLSQKTMVSKVIFYISWYEGMSIKEATDYVNNIRTANPREYEWLCAVAKDWVGSSFYLRLRLSQAFSKLGNAILDVFAKTFNI